MGADIVEAALLSLNFVPVSYSCYLVLQFTLHM